MRTRLRIWGNSLALRIPKPVAELLGLIPGSRVEIQVQNGLLQIVPVVDRYDLEALLTEVTAENKHAECFMSGGAE